MKLRNEIRKWHDGTSYAAVMTGDSTVVLNHDAMAAHALLQAMEEVNVHEYVFVANALIEVHRRAAEILAGWMGEERG